MKGLMRSGKLVLSAVFLALITVGAYVRVPIPVVPFTLQYPMTMLAGLVLGGELGCAVVAVYIFMGILGLPVFAGGGGFLYVLQPTFGYIIGFAIAAYVTGKIAHKAKSLRFRRLLLADFAGLAVVYAVGMVYCVLISRFYLGSDIEVWSFLLTCVLIPVPKDILMCILMAQVGRKVLHWARKVM